MAPYLFFGVFLVFQVHRPSKIASVGYMVKEKKRAIAYNKQMR